MAFTASASSTNRSFSTREQEGQEMMLSLSSAKTGTGVDEAFNTLAIAVVNAAMRGVEARKVEVDLRRKILIAVAQRGSLGVSRNEFFETIQGISYDELEKELARLEREALIQINWRGPANFTVMITPLGEQASRAP